MAASELELLRRWVAATNALKDRGLIRSAGQTPTGDYAEILVAWILAGERASAGRKGYDVILRDRTRVQVKARRDSGGKVATHFDIQALPAKEFQHFVGVVFNEDYSVKGAWWTSWKVVDDLSTPMRNGKHRLLISDLADRAGREDVLPLFDLTGPWIAFCAHCRQKGEVQQPERLRQASGKPAVKGVCPNCGLPLDRPLG